MRANATGMQGAIATGAIAVVIATLSSMNLAELKAWRIKRLEAALERFDNSKTILGQQLGYVDGAFVRQMLSGARPVTEKTIERIEAIEGMAGWFAPPAADDQPLVLTPEERLLVLTHRAVREQTNPYIEASSAPDNKVGRRKQKPRRGGKAAQGGHS